MVVVHTYGCVIGCGENGYTPPKIEQYYDPITKEPRPLTEYYQQINVDSSRSNVNGTSSHNAEIPTQIGIGVNQ